MLFCCCCCTCSNYSCWDWNFVWHDRAEILLTYARLACGPPQIIGSIQRTADNHWHRFTFILPLATSVFVPGGRGKLQRGFRRREGYRRDSPARFPQAFEGRRSCSFSRGKRRDICGTYVMRRVDCTLKCNKHSAHGVAISDAKLCLPRVLFFWRMLTLFRINIRSRSHRLSRAPLQLGFRHGR